MQLEVALKKKKAGIVDLGYARLHHVANDNTPTEGGPKMPGDRRAKQGPAMNTLQLFSNVGAPLSVERWAGAGAAAG